MKYFSEIRKQNDKKIIIKKPEVIDSQGWRDGAMTVSLEGKYLLVEPETVYSNEQIIAKIESNVDIEKQLMLVAKNENKVIGVLNANRKMPLKMNHVCEFGLWLIPEYRGYGIGTEMIVVMERWARDIGLRKICLSVFGNNYKAINLYKKLQYTTSGVQKNHIFMNDEFHDLILMEKEI